MRGGCDAAQRAALPGHAEANSPDDRSRGPLPSDVTEDGRATQITDTPTPPQHDPEREGTLAHLRERATHLLHLGLERLEHSIVAESKYVRCQRFRSPARGVRGLLGDATGAPTALEVLGGRIGVHMLSLQHNLNEVKTTDQL
jgi:hypothetical protein